MTANWLVTIPKLIKWESWMAEVQDALHKELLLFYRLPVAIRCQPGDRCFILWNGKVRGWLPIVGVEVRGDFMCETTGKRWLGGTFLVRQPRFHPVNGPALKGFQGVRRLPMNFLEAIMRDTGSGE